LYKCLEIEIDGVFKSLLLLKKKKYAALKIEGFNSNEQTFVKEVKGLDMVRRDWCDLSKNVGKFILDKILSGMARDEMIIALNDHLSNIGNLMKTNGIPLKDYIVTKQLTRALDSYNDDKSLPHVAVARRLKQAGKSEQDLSFINYVICKVDKIEGQSSVYLSQKAFSPDEVAT
jgi:DNA polymerase alpha subunit A